MEITKAPFNYIGNKYRIVKLIKRHFPEKINTMVDLFCGGCDMTINTQAKRIYANDINHFVIDICKEFQKNNINDLLYRIDEIITKWGLSKTNKSGYESFREYYNNSGSPLDLYVLMCYSFNYQFRFNSDLKYNNPFGKNRSSFNDRMRNNLIGFKKRIDGVYFSSCDFTDFDYSILKEGDFLYADPPYLISCGSYNDGKRGFRGWNDKDDADLQIILSQLSQRGVLFAMSNVVRHKGVCNQPLLTWAEKNNYIIHPIKFNYDNCNYQSKNKMNVTEEVLITNY